MRHQPYLCPGQAEKAQEGGLILSSGSDHVYSGAIYEYQNSFLNYLHLEDMGIFTACDKQNQSPEKLEELYQFGKRLVPDAPAVPRPHAGSGLPGGL